MVMKNKIYFLLISVIMYFFSAVGYGQEYKLITGKVEDLETKKPLSYASVSLINTTISNITNSDGVFTLKIPLNADNADSLNIRYIGYIGVNVAVTEFEGKKIKHVGLTPSVIALRGVTVRPEDAITLFNLAFLNENIKKNYPQKTCGLTGFYREIIKKGNQYVTLNEAVLDISKASYTDFSNDQLAIYKGRGNQNVKINDTLFLKLQGGPISTMYVDLVKNSFIGTDLLSAPMYYNFWMGPNVYKDGATIYTIQFNQKDSINETLFRGKIFIESESLAIVRAEFSMNVEDNPKAWREFVTKKPDNLKLGVDYANYVINYKKYNNKWYFDYARIDLKFNAKYKGKFLKNKYTIVSELAVTDIKNNIVPKLDTKKRIRPKDVMSSKVNDFTDNNFWENYNIIEPDESIENIISKIIKQLKKRSN